MWDSELVTRKLFLKLLVGKMEGGIIAIICCYQDRWDLFREQRQALPLNPVTLTHPGALHWKEKNQRLALWIAHISEWGRMSPALAGLTLLHITCAWSPVSTLQPCGAAPTWANTAPALEISQQDYRGAARAVRQDKLCDKHVGMACTAPARFIPGSATWDSWQRWSIKV